MKTNSLRREALIRILISFVIQFFYLDSYRNDRMGALADNGISASAALLILAGFYLWFSGFILYAKSKNKSEILSIVLAFLNYVGLIVILLLKDKSTSKPSRDKK